MKPVFPLGKVQYLFYIQDRDISQKNPLYFNYFKLEYPQTSLAPKTARIQKKYFAYSISYSMQGNSNFSNQHYSTSSNRSPVQKSRVNYSLLKIHHKGFQQFIWFGLFFFFQYQKKNTIFFRSWRFIKANGCQKESKPIKNQKDECKALLCPSEKKIFNIILYNFKFYFYILYICIDTYIPHL